MYKIFITDYTIHDNVSILNQLAELEFFFTISGVFNSPLSYPKALATINPTITKNIKHIKHIMHLSV